MWEKDLALVYFYLKTTGTYKGNLANLFFCEEIFEKDYEESFFWGTARQFSNQVYSHTLLKALDH